MGGKERRGENGERGEGRGNEPAQRDVLSGGESELDFLEAGEEGEDGEIEFAPGQAVTVGLSGKEGESERPKRKGGGGGGRPLLNPDTPPRAS